MSTSHPGLDVLVGVGFGGECCWSEAGWVSRCRERRAPLASWSGQCSERRFRYIRHGANGAFAAFNAVKAPFTTPQVWRKCRSRRAHRHANSRLTGIHAIRDTNRASRHRMKGLHECGAQFMGLVGETRLVVDPAGAREHLQVAEVEHLVFRRDQVRRGDCV
jgi:hypothetical protein